MPVILQCGHCRPQCGMGKWFPVFPSLTSDKELTGILVYLPQEVDHEDGGNSILEEPLVGVLCISQPQYPLHVGAPIAKLDFKEADLIRQHSYETLEGLRGFKFFSRCVSSDRIGLVALNFPERPAGLLGIFPPHPLLPSGVFTGAEASLTALRTLRVFFPRVGGWSNAPVALGATSGSFPTLRLGTLQRPSMFELILSFVGEILANLFPPDIPEPVTVFARPTPTIFGTTFNVSELVVAMVLFYLNWLVRGCFVAKK